MRNTLRALLLFCALSAFSLGVEEEPLPPPPIPQEAEFIDGCMELMGPLNRKEFVSYFNKYINEHPNALNTIFEALLDQELSALAHYLREEDYFPARDHYDQAASLAQILGKDLAEETLELVTLARIKGLVFETSELTGAPFFGTPQNIKDINTLIPLVAEIGIHQEYTTENGVKRYSYDDFSGSGFLIEEDLVVTNYHVIAPYLNEDNDSARIRITIQDKDYADNQLLGIDPLGDLALIRLGQKAPLPFRFIDLIEKNPNLQLGDRIYSLGSHLGFTNTVTQGIVSSPDREALEHGRWIQIDANMSPGASGGPALDENFKIVGINVAGISGEDINFVIPMSTLLDSLDRMKAGHTILRPWLGLQLEEPRVKGDADNPKGLKIDYIFPSSPLSQIDNQSHLSLMKVNNEVVQTVEEAKKALFRSPVGGLNLLTLKGVNGMGESLFLTQSLKRPEEPLYSGTLAISDIDSLYPYYGFSVSKSSMQAITFGEKTLAVFRITKVNSRSFVHSYGLREGIPWPSSTIVSVGRNAVWSFYTFPRVWR
jgi:S1-C subfamily serine protease